MAKSAAKVEKPLTKVQLFTNLAEKTGLTKKQIAEVFDALKEEIASAVGKKGVGTFVIPDLCKVVRHQKKALPKRQVRNPQTGEMIWLIQSLHRPPSRCDLSRNSRTWFNSNLILDHRSVNKKRVCKSHTLFFYVHVRRRLVAGVARLRSVPQQTHPICGQIGYQPIVAGVQTFGPHSAQHIQSVPDRLPTHRSRSRQTSSALSKQLLRQIPNHQPYPRLRSASNTSNLWPDRLPTNRSRVARLRSVPPANTSNLRQIGYQPIVAGSPTSVRPPANTPICHRLRHYLFEILATSFQSRTASSCSPSKRKAFHWQRPAWLALCHPSRFLQPQERPCRAGTRTKCRRQSRQTLYCQRSKESPKSKRWSQHPVLLSRLRINAVNEPVQIGRVKQIVMNRACRHRSTEMIDAIRTPLRHATKMPHQSGIFVLWCLGIENGLRCLPASIFTAGDRSLSGFLGVLVRSIHQRCPTPSLCSDLDQLRCKVCCHKLQESR